MNIHDINPHIRYARFHRNTRLEDILRYCYDCRLFFFIQGSCTFQAGDLFYNICENTALFVPPGTGYRFICTADAPPPDLIVFNFDLTSEYAHLKESLGTAGEADFFPGKVLKYTLPDKFSSVTVQHIPHIYDTLKKCTDEFLHKEQYYRETSSALLKLCLLDLLRESSVSSEFKIIPQVTEYIHGHYHEPELTNEYIARQFGYHPYYLSQLMKKATGETLHAYLLHYRIRIAKNYLITTTLDITTVAWKCGFNSPAYFIKQFKLRTGCTPKQYRKANIDSVL